MPVFGKMDEATLVIIKPDGLQKSLTGNVLTRLSETKLVIIGTKIKSVPRKLAEEHYRDMKEKPFFEEIVKYLIGDFHTKRVLALIYYGPDAIQKIRKVCGATNPEEADPSTIRGAFGRITTKGEFENVVHSSSSESDAEREINRWFKPEEIVVSLYPTQTITHPNMQTTVWG